MKGSRKTMLAAGVLCATFGISSTAQAATTQSITASVSPSKAGTKKKPRGVKLAIRLSATTTGGLPPATSKAEVFLPKELKLNGSKFASCTAAILNNSNQGPSKCPKGSKVGSGSARAIVVGQQVPIKVTAFNGPKGRSLLLYLQASGIANIEQALEGKLSRSGGGNKLTVPIPAALQQPLPGVFAPLVDFSTSLRASTKVKKKGAKKKVKVNFLELNGCPSSKKLPFKSINTYAAGSTGATPVPSPITATSTATCSK